MSSWNRQVSALGCFHQSGRLLIIRLLIPRPGAHRSVYAVQNYGFDLFCSLDKVSLTIQAFLWITIQALLSGPLKLFKVQVLSCFQWNQMSSFTYRSIVGCAFGHTSIVAFLPPPSSPSTEGPTGTYLIPVCYPTFFSVPNPVQFWKSSAIGSRNIEPIHCWDEGCIGKYAPRCEATC